VTFSSRPRQTPAGSSKRGQAFFSKDSHAKAPRRQVLLLKTIVFFALFAALRETPLLFAALRETPLLFAALRETPLLFAALRRAPIDPFDKLRVRVFDRTGFGRHLFLVDHFSTSLHDRAMNPMDLYKECRLCPRACGVDRVSGGRKGFCKENAELRVAYIGPHFGEEPPLSGTRGSGTIFFTGCSLRCTFCQNYQISRDGLGEALEMDELLKRVETMIKRDGVHNVNFVTPDHFFPHAFSLITALRERGHTLPMVFNLSGYQSRELLKLAHAHVDIYLPDYKYADRNLAERLSRCKDYPDAALSAIAEMVADKGFLDFFENDLSLARKGVVVRHLILPGYVDNSLDALTTLFLEFGRCLPLSLMSQYCPVLHHEDANLNRPLTKNEFDRVYAHALDLGFDHLYVQIPEEAPVANTAKRPAFVPDFRLGRPFLAQAPEN
jgi:putative pyruvate formate lyase activating enzyme